MPKRKVKAITITLAPTFGCFTILGIILVLLKLLGVEDVADVSWWVVLLPFYIWPAILLALSLFIFGTTAAIGLALAFLSLF